MEFKFEGAVKCFDCKNCQTKNHDKNGPYTCKYDTERILRIEELLEDTMLCKKFRPLERLFITRGE